MMLCYQAVQCGARERNVVGLFEIELDRRGYRLQIRAQYSTVQYSVTQHSTAWHDVTNSIDQRSLNTDCES